MQFKIQNRYSLSIAVIALYLVPLFFLSFYSIGLMSKSKSWLIFSTGLFTIVCGALGLMLLLYYWEQALKNKNQEQDSLASNIQPLDKHKVAYLDSSQIMTDLNKPDNINRESITLLENSKQLNSLQKSLEECQEQQTHLLEDIQYKNTEIQKLEKELQEWVEKAEQASRDLSDYKIFSEEQLNQKSIQINSLQQSLDTQQQEIDKRQTQIQQLDSKIHDLSYEIKTLLYLNESEPSFKMNESSQNQEFAQSNRGSANSNISPLRPDTYSTIAQLEEAQEEIVFSDTQITTPQEASALLKHCIGIAHKLMGTNYYGSETSRYWEFIPHYTIDQRQLFDNLSNENGGLIFVYSPKESRVLFANSQSKNLLGWSSEKFLQDFNSLLQEGNSDWKNSVNLLTSSSESQTRLLLKTKNGKEILMNCHLGLIQSGLFRSYIIGVLYKTPETNEALIAKR